MFNFFSEKKNNGGINEEELNNFRHRLDEYFAEEDADSALSIDIDEEIENIDDIEFEEKYNERLKEIDIEMQNSGFNFNTYQEEDLHNDIQIIESYIEYNTKEQADYFMFNLRFKEDYEEEWTEAWKCVKLLKLEGLPRNFRETKGLLTTWDDVLVGFHDQDMNFLTLIANILKPERIGLVFCYGVQSVAETPDRAKKMADIAYQALCNALMGNFTQIEFRLLYRKEADWIERQLREMKHLLMLRGIPKPRNSAGAGVTSAMGGSVSDPTSEEQNEEFLRGMSTSEYLLLLLTSPVGFSDLQKWLKITSDELSKYKSESQGQKSLSAGLSIPMMFAGNLGAAFGRSFGESNSFGHASGVTLGDSFSLSSSEGISEGISTSHSESLSQSLSLSHGETQSISFSEGQGLNYSEGLSQTEGFSKSLGISESSGVSLGQGASFGESISEGYSASTSFSTTLSESQGISHSMGASSGITESQGISHSVSTGESFGESVSFGQSVGQSQGTSMSGSISTGTSESFGTSASQSVGQSFGTSTSESFGTSESVSQSVGTSSSTGTSASFGTSNSVGNSHVIGESQTQTSSQTHGTSQSVGSSESFGTSSSIGSSWGSSTSQSTGTSSSNGGSLSFSNSVSDGTSSSTGTSMSQSYGESTSISSGFSHSNSNSQSVSNSESLSYSQGKSHSLSHSISSSATYSESFNESYSKGVNYGQNEGVSLNMSSNRGESISVGYNRGGSLSGGVTFGIGNVNVSFTEGVNSSQSVNTGTSMSVGSSYGLSKGVSYSEGHSHGVSTSGGLSESVGATNGSSESIGSSFSHGTSTSFSESVGESIGLSQGTSTSTGLSQSTSNGTSHSTSTGMSEGTSWSTGTSSSISSSESLGGSSSQGTSHSTGTSSSIGTSSSFGSSSANATSENFGTTTSSGTSQSFGTSTSQGISQSTGVSQGVSTSHGTGTSESTSMSSSTGISTSKGTSQSQSISQGVTQGTSTSQSLSSGLSHSTSTSESVGQSLSYGKSNTLSETYGTSTSQSAGISEGISQGVSNSHGFSYGKSTSQGISQSQGTSLGTGISSSQGLSASKGSSLSVGRSLGDSTSLSQSQGIGTSVGDSVGISKGTSKSEGISAGTSKGTSTTETSSLGLSQGISQTSSTGSSASMGLGPSISYSKSSQWIDEHKINLATILDEQRNRLMSALQQGAFYVDVFILTADEKSKKAASVLSTSAWYGEVFPCPVQVVEPDPIWAEHLMIHAAAFSACSAAEDAIELMEGYKFSTVLLPQELSAYCHPPRFEGGDLNTIYETIPYFHLPGQMEGEAFMGWCISTETGNVTETEYRFNKKNMMHTLISGSSGSGKTTTSLRFISELINKMKFGATILDWKDDWRSLAFVVPEEKFTFFSLGTTEVNRLHFNPLAIPDKVDVDLWVDSVVESFVIGFGLGQRGYEILWRNLAALYSMRGVWKDTTKSRSLTLMDLFNQIQKEIDDKGAQKKAGFGDVEAYNRVLSRMGYFTNTDSKLYTMFGNPDSVEGQPVVRMEELCKPGEITVLEAQGLKGPQKSFILGLISAGIFQVARSQKIFINQPHMIVFEEAHEVVKGTDTAGGDSGTGVTEESVYEVMWNEGRSAGLYLVALAQMPTHLPTSVLANTRIYITHQLGNDEDIDFIARRMVRDPRIEDKNFPRFLEKVPLGYAIIQTRNIRHHRDAEPVLIKVEMIEAPRPTDEQLTTMMHKKQGFIYI